MRNNKTIIILVIITSILVIATIAGIIFIGVSKNNKNSGKVIVNASEPNNAEIEAEKIKNFNEQFSGYEGEEISGTLVKSLLSAIILNNNSDADHQVTVKISDTEIEEGTTDTADIANIQKTINREDIYKVEYNKENEYITEIKIEKTEGDNISREAQRFNQNFMSYEDKTITGKEVKGTLVTLIRDSNRENEEHQIEIVSGELTSISQIKDDAEYKITLTFDDEGYLNRIDADEQTENNTIERENETVNEIENMMNSALQQYQDDTSERSSDEDL